MQLLNALPRQPFLGLAMAASTGILVADFAPNRSLVLSIALAILALYVYGLAGSWRWIYVAGAVLALYLNVFVGVVQAFQKLTFLAPRAPTQSEPPFVVAQVVVLVIFIALGVLALRSFHPQPDM